MNRKTFAALAAATFALAGAAPASAMPSDGTGSESSCELKTSLGSQFYGHGSTVTVVDSNGKDKKYRCNNGTWEEVKTAQATKYRVHGKFPTAKRAR